MKKSKYLVQMLALALAALWGFSASAAATETFTINNGGLETFGLTWDTHSESALAGGITLTRVSGSIPTFNTVCTDIGATVYLGYSYVYSSPTVFGNQDGILPSWGSGNAGIPLDTPWTSLTSVQQANATAAINAAADIFYHHQGVLTTGSTSDRAALQLAVWEALYDTTAGSTAYGLGGGRFSVSSGDSSAISEAALWLSQVNVNAKYAGYLLIPSPENQNGTYNQEMLYNVTPVPEPTTMIAGALLLLPFGASTLRILRKSRAA
jgi:hypothetical protein